MKTWVFNHARAARQSWARLLGEPLQTLMTASVIGIALTLPAVMYTLANSFSASLQGIDQTSSIQVYFQLGTERADIESLLAQLQSQDQVSEASLISPEQGLADFRANSGLGDLLSTLDDNPIPPLAIVTPSQRLTENPAQLRLMIDGLVLRDEVDQVVFDYEWLRRLSAIANTVTRLAYALGALLGVGLILVMGNTIRLVIESRRDEILVVKLVGGTDAYVGRPLIYSGIWYGLLGGLLSILITAITIAVLALPMEQLALAYNSVALKPSNLSPAALLVLLSLGVGLGYLGAKLAVVRHLSDIEPA